MKEQDKKYCCRCKQFKGFSDFYLNSTLKLGISSWCKLCDSIRHKDYYRKNKDKIKNRNKKWRTSNLEKVRKYENGRHKNDIKYKLAKNLRVRTRMALRFNRKTGSAVRDLGCSIDELKKQMEKMFYPNPETGESMSWENYGKGRERWNIDHIRPLDLCDLTDEVQFKEAAHHSNIQPLWFIDNRNKGNKA